MTDRIIPFPIDPAARRREELAASLGAIQRMRGPAAMSLPRPRTSLPAISVPLRSLPRTKADPRYGNTGASVPASEPTPAPTSVEDGEAEDPVERIRREAAESSARRRSAYEDSLRTIRALYGLPDDYKPSPLPPAA